MSRFCYKTVMRFWQDDLTTVNVRYYRADDDAKAFVGWHSFGPSGREGEKGIEPNPVGEAVFPPSLGYDRGQNTGGWLGQHFDGPRDAWESGGVHGTTPVIETDGQGGTPQCPWNGHPGPVIMATVPHMSGQIVAVGAPGILSRLDGSGLPDPAWNPEVLPALARWCLANGKALPLAAVYLADHWQWFAESPYFSDFGSDHLDYSADSAQEELRVQLRGANALVLGFYVTDQSTPDWIDERVIDIVHSWVCGGGILILVGDIDQFDNDGQHPANHVLSYMNAEMRFEHGDVIAGGGPVVGLFPVPVSFATSSGPGYLWTYPDRIISPAPDYGVAFVTSPLLLSKRIVMTYGLTDTRIIGDGVVRATWKGGYFVHPVHGHFFAVVHFENAADAGVGDPNLMGSGFLSINSGLVTVFASGPHAIVRITSVEFWFDNGPVLDGAEVHVREFQLELIGVPYVEFSATLNQRHPMVQEDGTVYLSSLLVRSTATIVRGDWVACLAGQTVTRPQAQFYLAHIEGRATGVYLGVLSHAHGSAAGLVGPLTGSAAGTFTAAHTGTVAGLVGPFEGSAIGGYLTFATGAAAGLVGPFEGSAIGGYLSLAGGSAAGLVGPFDGLAAGTYTPVYAGIASGLVGPFTGSAIGGYLTFASGSASGLVGPFTGSAIGGYLTFASGSASGLVGPFTGSAAGTYLLVFTGTASGAVAAFTGAAAGLYHTHAIGTASGDLAAFTGTGAGGYLTFASGAAVGILPSFTGASAGTFSASVTYTGSASGAVGPLTGTAAGWGQTAHGDTTYTGPATWHCPVGVTTADVRCRGGGGSAFTTPTSNGSVGGGGGGTYSANASVSVTAGTGYAVQPGQPQALGVDGQSSSFGSALVVAVGGKHGTAVAGGAGGLSTSCVGVTKFSGGNGAAGSSTTFGGAGGGGAGDGAVGGNAVSFSGGPGGLNGGGAGGAGGRSGTPAAAGTAPGGGGGGGVKSLSLNWASQQGAAGSVRIIW